MSLDFLVYLSAYVGLFATIFYALGLLDRHKKRKTNKEDLSSKLLSVSIIIPAYNEEKGIVNTIKSALSLDYPKNLLEIIVVDDGSKDNTFKAALGVKSKILRVFSKKNGGKGSALNYGIKKAKGEIIVTMDADSIVEPETLRYQVAYFKNPKVMCVSPTVVVYKPRTFLERVQQVEYLLGVFLREAFAGFNALHITPGAFSAYRKYFFDKYGGFSENNLTEDFEVALRIQYHQFIIENSRKSVVYTVAPKGFVGLYKQRKRWYVGLMRNTIDYSEIFSKKFGALGTIVLPVAFITIIMSVLLTSYLVINSLQKLKNELVLLNSINFNFLSTIDFSRYAVGRYFFLIFSDPKVLLFIPFLFIIMGYMLLAKKTVKRYTNTLLSLPIFLFSYSFLFSFWWILSFIYSIFNRKIRWR